MSSIISPSPDRNRKSGFTLLEFLIVIGVTMLLLTILLPVVQSIRGNARAANCASRLANIGRAMQNYKIDKKRMVGPQGWRCRLAAYLELEKVSSPNGLADSTIFKCPDNTTDSSSFGINERVHMMGIKDSGKIMALDFSLSVVRAVTNPNVWPYKFAPRHFNMSNILFFDSRVVRMNTIVPDPRECEPFLSYWVPTRDMRFLSSSDCDGLPINVLPGLPSSPPPPTTGPGTGQDPPSDTLPNGNLDLLPFALDLETWNAMQAGTGPDGWTWDEATQTVVPGPDRILEMDLYPQGTGSPGNRGTVDICNPGNSTADIIRQILYGISTEDLSYCDDGALTFDANGELFLEGDTGISVGVKEELESIIGQPRTIPIFSSVENPGNNAVYTIVAFAKIRILEVVLTGPPTGQRVMIQVVEE